MLVDGSRMGASVKCFAFRLSQGSPVAHGKLHKEKGSFIILEGTRSAT